MRQFAISDIHGCATTFKALLRQIEFSIADELYLLGDFVDRGADSKDVFDHIFELQDSGHTVHCLRGNHEAMMLDSNISMDKHLMWLRNGGRETLDSFGADNLAAIPRRYLNFINAMPYYLEVGNYLLVHAGFNFSIPVEDIFTAKDSMLWIRNWYRDINKTWLGERIIVHGHTPTIQSDIKMRAKKLAILPALDIDAGCVYAHYGRGLGNLCAFELNTQQLYFQENTEL